MAAKKKLKEVIKKHKKPTKRPVQETPNFEGEKYLRQSATAAIIPAPTPALVTVEDRLAGAETLLREGLQVLTNVLSLSEMTPPQKAQTFLLTKTVTEALSKSQTLIRDALLDYTKTNGKPFNENGSIEAHIPGYRLEVRRVAPKLDDEKVQALLSARGIPLSVAMEERVSHVTNETKLIELSHQTQGQPYFGVVTPEDVKNCMTEEKWQVQSPKPVKEVEDA